jgi:probable phosphoglycerate mutase
VAILLIRHGETPSNAARVIQTPDTPLSERGREQAERLARRLRGEGVAHILSSDLSRAVMTSEALRAATGVRLELEPLLQERDFGDLRGTPYAELAQDLFGPQFVPPGGESWEVFHRRVDTAWDRVREIATGTPGNLAVVTHGLVCHSLVSRHLAKTAVDPEVTGFANTALTIVEASPPWRVRLLACTAHLEAEHGGAPV